MTLPDKTSQLCLTLTVLTLSLVFHLQALVEDDEAWRLGLRIMGNILIIMVLFTNAWIADKRNREAKK